MSCSCKTGTDRHGRETISLCPGCREEFDRTHQAARESGSEVWKQAHQEIATSVTQTD